MHSPINHQPTSQTSHYYHHHHQRPPRRRTMKPTRQQATTRTTTTTTTTHDVSKHDRHAKRCHHNATTRPPPTQCKHNATGHTKDGQRRAKRARKEQRQDVQGTPVFFILIYSINRNLTTLSIPPCFQNTKTQKTRPFGHVNGHTSYARYLFFLILIVITFLAYHTHNPQKRAPRLVFGGMTSP